LISFVYLVLSKNIHLVQYTRKKKEEEEEEEEENHQVN